MDRKTNIATERGEMKLVGREKRFLKMTRGSEGAEIWSCFYPDAEGCRHEYDLKLKDNPAHRG